MSDTNKDKLQALLKRGEAQYNRHNKRKSKQPTQPKLPQEVVELKNFPAASEGFFAKLANMIHW